MVKFMLGFVLGLVAGYVAMQFVRAAPIDVAETPQPLP